MRVLNIGRVDRFCGGGQRVVLVWVVALSCTGMEEETIGSEHRTRTGYARLQWPWLRGWEKLSAATRQDRQCSGQKNSKFRHGAVGVQWQVSWFGRRADGQGRIGSARLSRASSCFDWSEQGGGSCSLLESSCRAPGRSTAGRAHSDTATRHWRFTARKCSLEEVKRRAVLGDRYVRVR